MKSMKFIALKKRRPMVYTDKQHVGLYLGHTIIVCVVSKILFAQYLTHVL